MSDRPTHEEIAELLALMIHDLRNPAATVSANLSFIRESVREADVDALEALEDVETAMGDLARGLEQLSWIGRWLGGERALEAGPGDARASVQAAVHRIGRAVAVAVPDEPVEVAAGGNALSRLVELLVRNALAFADARTVLVVLAKDGEHVVVEVRDGGRAISDELSTQAFTLAGQSVIKGRADGRYSRAAGLLAARVLAEGLGAELDAGGADGAAFFRARLPSAGSTSAR